MQFLETYSSFDWETHGLSLQGTVVLDALPELKGTWSSVERGVTEKRRAAEDIIHMEWTPSPFSLIPNP